MGCEVWQCYFLISQALVAICEVDDAAIGEAVLGMPPDPCPQASPLAAVIPTKFG